MRVSGAIPPPSLTETWTGQANPLPDLARARAFLGRKDMPPDGSASGGIFMGPLRHRYGLLTRRC